MASLSPFLEPHLNAFPSFCPAYPFLFFPSLFHPLSWLPTISSFHSHFLHSSSSPSFPSYLWHFIPIPFYPSYLSFFLQWIFLHQIFPLFQSFFYLPSLLCFHLYLLPPSLSLMALHPFLSSTLHYPISSLPHCLAFFPPSISHFLRPPSFPTFLYIFYESSLDKAALVWKKTYTFVCFSLVDYFYC